MKRERCPGCGGTLNVESEMWTAGTRRLTRTLLCDSCGSRFESSVDWPRAVPPSERARPRHAAWRVVGWVSLALLCMWLALRSMDYGTVRVAVYSAVARAAESFLHPAWGVGLLTLAVVALGASRRRRRPEYPRAALAPAVQLRAESRERISVVFSDARGAVGRDAAVERSLEAEHRVAETFQAIARRTSSLSAGAGGVWTREQVENAQRELYSLGLTIGTELLGGSSDIAEALADLPGDHLQLGIPGDLAAVPWELMVPRRGGQYLWQLFSVTRQLRVDAVAGKSCESSGTRNMLVLANLEAGAPGRELAAAEREAGELLELGATRPESLKVVRKSPRDASELRGLLRGGFDIVHFAGHTAELMGGGAGWVLGAGETVDPSSVLPEVAPALVFANACSSGTDGRTGIGESARALMEAGVLNYVCTLAELHDEGSASFARAFYSALARGETLGRALTSARAALMGVHPFTWANYVLYGDPTLRLL